MSTEREKQVGTLALLLHNEFCTNSNCNGLKDWLAPAERLLPKIETLVLS